MGKVLKIGGGLIGLIVVLVLVFGGGGEGVPKTCEELAPRIVDLSTEKKGPLRPVILKLYQVETVPPSGDRVLNCRAEGLLDTGAENVRVNFALKRDAEGEHFIGYDLVQ